MTMIFAILALIQNIHLSDVHFQAVSETEMSEMMSETVLSDSHAGSSEGTPAPTSINANASYTSPWKRARRGCLLVVCT